MKKERLEKRKEAKEKQLAAAYEAYTALLDGGVQKYILGNRELTRLNLSELRSAIKELEREVDMLESQLAGKRGRRAFAVIPTNW